MKKLNGCSEMHAGVFVSKAHGKKKHERDDE
jgi:hypothetical protein